ncbi:MAG: UDP-glucose 4-epimerase GalE [Planctomycetes bacterium]|nr:UDP-glucose 4-epimerase GalE [Planctomycetota bacterium]
MSDNIIVTGGAGYIGSHVCKQLSLAGYTPVTFDNLNRGNKNAVKWGPLEVGHLADTEHVKKVLAKYQPVAVVHMAALAYVGESVEHPDMYYNNNVIGTLSLADAMKSTGIRNIVFSSSCAVYGTPNKIPIDENSPQIAENPYGASKHMAERILADYGCSFGFSSVSLRYFNAAGTDPEMEIGELHDPEPHLIPRAIKAAVGEIHSLDIFGTDYDTPDGTAIRDYVHVTDLANGHVSAIKYLLGGGVTIALNLGAERGYSVSEILLAVERFTGNKIPVNEAPRREGDPAKLIANSSKAKKIIAWKTQFSDIGTIIKTAVEWQKINSN